MEDGFARVSVDTWLEVIPQVGRSARVDAYQLKALLQIIARIQTPSSSIRRLIGSLLTDVGRAHPQALIYPLTVASKSSNELRVNSAKSIMDRMREHSPVIVNEVRSSRRSG